MYPNSIELLFMRCVPHIVEIVLLSLDYTSYKTCFEVCKAWNELLTTDTLRRKGKYVFDKEISEDETKLWHASRCGILEEVRRLLSYGLLDVDCVRLADCTPLGIAAFWGHKEVVKILLEQGADCNKGTCTYDIITNSITKFFAISVV